MLQPDLGFLYFERIQSVLEFKRLLVDE